MTALAGAWTILRAPDGTVTIAQETPINADAAMAGLAPEAAARLTGVLHAVCPQAHMIALAAAVEAARGEGADLPTQALRARRIAFEAAAGAALRFGAHWPLAFGERPSPDALAARRALAGDDRAGLAAACARLAGDRQTEAFAARAAEALGDLPDPDDRSRPLAARLRALMEDGLARAQALADGLDGAPVRAAGAPPHGSASIATLRGALDVRLTLKDGRIAAFASDAPTDRLVAVNGSLARAVADAPSEAAARAALLALDPCAPITLRFNAGAPVHA